MERIVASGRVQSLVQDDYDDGIQTLLVKMAEGSAFVQKFEWPEMKFRGETSTASMIETFNFLYSFDHDLAYAFACKFAKLIEGPQIKVVSEDEYGKDLTPTGGDLREVFGSIFDDLKPRLQPASTRGLDHNQQEQDDANQ